MLLCKTVKAQFLRLKIRMFITFLDTNACDTEPCQNGGKCTDGTFLYYCTCDNGYNGTNCENGKHVKIKNLRFKSFESINHHT